MASLRALASLTALREPAASAGGAKPTVRPTVRPRNSAARNARKKREQKSDINGPHGEREKLSQFARDIARREQMNLPKFGASICCGVPDHRRRADTHVTRATRPSAPLCAQRCSPPLASVRLLRAKTIARPTPQKAASSARRDQSQMRRRTMTSSPKRLVRWSITTRQPPP